MDRDSIWLTSTWLASHHWRPSARCRIYSAVTTGQIDYGMACIGNCRNPLRVLEDLHFQSHNFQEPTVFEIWARIHVSPEIFSMRSRSRHVRYSTESRFRDRLVMSTSREKNIRTFQDSGPCLLGKTYGMIEWEGKRWWPRRSCYRHLRRKRYCYRCTSVLSNLILFTALDLCALGLRGN